MQCSVLLLLGTSGPDAFVPVASFERCEQLVLVQGKPDTVLSM